MFETERMLLTSKCGGECGRLRARRGALRGHCWWWWGGLRGGGGGWGWWHLPLGSCGGLLGNTKGCVRTEPVRYRCRCYADTSPPDWRLQRSAGQPKVVCVRTEPVRHVGKRTGSSAWRLQQQSSGNRDLLWYKQIMVLLRQDLLAAHRTLDGVEPHQAVLRAPSCAVKQHASSHHRSSVSQISATTWNNSKPFMGLSCKLQQRSMQASISGVCKTTLGCKSHPPAAPPGSTECAAPQSSRPPAALPQSRQRSAQCHQEVKLHHTGWEHPGRSLPSNVSAPRLEA